MMQTQILAHSVSIMTEYKHHLTQQLYAETNAVYAETHSISWSFFSHDGFYLLWTFWRGSRTCVIHT